MLPFFKDKRYMSEKWNKPILGNLCTKFNSEIK